MTERNTFSMITPSPDNANRVCEILGLPADIPWSALEVRFGFDFFGEATITLIATGEQICDLAELAIQPREQT